MFKKILIIAAILSMLSGCFEKKPITDPTPFPEASPSPTTTEVQSSSSPDSKEEETNKTKTSSEPLKAPEVSSAKKDPKRTAEIPETANPKKVVTKAPDKTVGAGVRSDEVSSEAISATSPDNAVKLVTQFMKNNNTYIPSSVECDREDDNYYYIHAYETVKDSNGTHTATVGWYNVSKKTSQVQAGEAPIEVGKRPDSYNQ